MVVGFVSGTAARQGSPFVAWGTTLPVGSPGLSNVASAELWRAAAANLLVRDSGACGMLWFDAYRRLARTSGPTGGAIFPVTNAPAAGSRRSFSAPAI